MWHLKKKRPSWQSIKGVQVSVKLRRHGTQRGRCARVSGLDSNLWASSDPFFVGRGTRFTQLGSGLHKSRRRTHTCKRGWVAMANAREKPPEGRRVYNAVAMVAKQCMSQGKRALAWSWEQLEPHFTHVYCNSRVSCWARRPDFGSSSPLLDFFWKPSSGASPLGVGGATSFINTGTAQPPKSSQTEGRSSVDHEVSGAQQGS